MFRVNKISGKDYNLQCKIGLRTTSMTATKIGSKTPNRIKPNAMIFFSGSVTSTDSGLGFFDHQNCDSEFPISPRISQQRKMSESLLTFDDIV